MYYEIEGTGTPLVFIPPAFGFAGLESFPGLVQNHSVITVDLQGNGRTADIPERPISIEHYAEDVVGLLKYLKISKADFFGESYGGNTAVMIAIRHPELVGRVATYAATFGPGSVAINPDTAHFDAPPTAESSYVQFHRDSYKEVAPDPNYWPKIFDKVGSIQWSGFSKQELATIKVPILIVLGDHDFVRLEHAVETFKLIPNAEIAVIPNASHFAPFSEPERVIPVVKHFLEQPERPLPLATARTAITPEKPDKGYEGRCGEKEKRGIHMCPLCLATLLAASATSGGGLWVLTRITGRSREMKTSSTKVQHKVGTREEWLAERLALLKAEKEHTRRGDELALLRQELPWVRVEKEYRFETDDGKASFSDLFRGRSQLLVYHLMFGPDYTAACPSCSAIADGFNGFHIHLANHDVMLWAVSRAPLAKLQAYKLRMGWTFPWASSYGSDFNFDYSVGFTEEQQCKEGLEYNYQHEAAIPANRSRQSPHAAMCGVDTPTYLRERPGVSSFALEDGVVYHTYSSYGRGVDGLWGMYQWLDRAPKGRNESGPWWRRHDEYAKQ